MYAFNDEANQGSKCGLSQIAFYTATSPFTNERVDNLTDASKTMPEHGNKLPEENGPTTGGSAYIRNDFARNDVTTNIATEVQADLTDNISPEASPETSLNLTQDVRRNLHPWRGLLSKCIPLLDDPQD